MSGSRPSLVLYKFTRCSFCVAVMEYLTRRRITIPQRDILTDPEGLTELIRLGGKRQVPCLIIDGKALYESEDIIEWFEKHWDQNGNAPTSQGLSRKLLRHDQDREVVTAGLWQSRMPRMLTRFIDHFHVACSETLAEHLCEFGAAHHVM